MATFSLLLFRALRLFLFATQFIVAVRGGDVHLFASPSLLPVDERGNFTMVVPPVVKSPANPLLREGLSVWDMAWWNTYPTVIFDGARYKLWYNGFASCDGNHASTMCPSSNYPNRTNVPPTDRKIGATYYAESEDGLTWALPALGQVPWPTENGSKHNNMAIDAGGADPNRGIYYDEHESDTARRYKAFGSFKSFQGQSIGGSKLGIVTSPDGKGWNEYTPVDEMQVNADTANNLLWDSDIQQYLAFTRKDVSAGKEEYGLRREYRSTAPKYTGPWSVAEEVGHGEFGYELYALVPWRDKSWPAGEYWAVGSFYADAQKDQKVYCELLHSTDYGRNFTRVAPHTPFIPLGTAGEFDSHTCYPARPLVDPRDADRMLLYYSGGNGPHSGARSDFIAVATTQTHAFVGIMSGTAAVASSSAHHVLTTAPLPPMAAASPSWGLRLATMAGASVKVSVLSADGALEICEAEPILHGDAGLGIPARRELVFPLSCAISKGDEVRLRVEVEGSATLYALHVDYVHLHVYGTHTS